MSGTTAHQNDVFAPAFSIPLKRAVPWLFLGALLVLMFGMYNQYRVRAVVWNAQQAKLARTTMIPDPKKAAERAKSAAAAKTLANAEKVQALTGVNFRTQPSASSDTIRTLDTGEQVLLVSKVGSWYKVKDKDGRIGWVTASKSYTKVVGGK